jgi:hypothetical protein
MVARIAEFRRRTSKYLLIAFAIALLIHLASIIAVLTSDILDKRVIAIKPLTPYEKLPQTEQKPLKLEELPHLLDIPEEARTERPPDDPNPDIADKNAVARNWEEKDLPEGLPFSEGQLDIRTMEDREEEQHAPFDGARPLDPRRGGMKDFRDAKEIPKWTRELLLRPDRRGKGGKGGKTEGDGLADNAPDRLGPKEKVYIPKDDLNELARAEEAEPGYKPHRKFGIGIGNSAPRLPQYKNKRSIARDFGDFSFSSIAWDYAPYLYYLRERVKRYWHPPEAFQLGIVSGRVIIQFKIMRNGDLEDLEILSYRDNDVAYQSLVNASRNAILAASPFRSLPEDFPDDYLEIRGTFYYQILGYEDN